MIGSRWVVALSMVLVSSCLVLSLWSCGGGGGSSPTEPQPPAPQILVLHVSWEYDLGEGPVTGVSHPIGGNTILLANFEGGYCEVVDGLYVCYPDVAECRTTPDGGLQAYYHDSLAADDPGILGPQVTSGCSFAEEYGYYANCCLMDS